METKWCDIKITVMLLLGKLNVTLHPLELSCSSMPSCIHKLMQKGTSIYNIYISFTDLDLVIIKSHVTKMVAFSENSPLLCFAIKVVAG